MKADSQIDKKKLLLIDLSTHRMALPAKAIRQETYTAERACVMTPSILRTGLQRSRNKTESNSVAPNDGALRCQPQTKTMVLINNSGAFTGLEGLSPWA